MFFNPIFCPLHFSIYFLYIFYIFSIFFPPLEISKKSFSKFKNMAFLCLIYIHEISLVGLGFMAYQKLYVI